MVEERIIKEEQQRKKILWIRGIMITQFKMLHKLIKLMNKN